MLHGKALDSLFAYNLGWYGGKGQNVLSNNNDNALAARIVVNPLGDMPYSEGDIDCTANPLVSFGADYYMDTLTKNTAGGAATTLQTNNLNFAQSTGWLGRSANLVLFAPQKIDIDEFSIDAALKWRGLSAQGEYYWGEATGQTTNTKVIAQGYYAQAGYFIIPKHLQAAFRYSYVDPNRNISNDLQTEVQGAVSYYFNKHNLKLQGDISSIHQQNLASPTTDTMQYRLQAQIIF